MMNTLSDEARQKYVDRIRERIDRRVDKEQKRLGRPVDIGPLHVREAAWNPVDKIWTISGRAVIEGKENGVTFEVTELPPPDAEDSAN